MRLHKNLLLAVVDALDKIFNENLYADRVITQLLKSQKRWGARDRKFVAETLYEIVRWKRLYNEIAETKNHYTRDNIWKIIAVWLVLKGHQLPEWRYFENTPVRRIKGRFDQLQSQRKFRESIPDWIDDLGEKELGKNWDTQLKALNKPAQVVLRCNTLKAEVRTIQEALDEEGFEATRHPEYPSALILKERQNVFKSESFKKGYFEVQDASSQLVAPYLDVKPGMRVIDTCAGAGGKTLHLASLMENKGQLIAMDIYQHKLVELKKRAKRAGAFNIQTNVIGNSKTYKKFYGTADRVLIDAPCSGLGVLKRNPDSKWKLRPEFMDEIRTVQQELLQLYSKFLKPGGKLVYATCSLLPSENHQQIETFLALQPDFKLLKDHAPMPADSGFDGFYMALLEKKVQA